MSRYLLRLDDASDYSDRERWQRMETLLDRYGILPIVGIIPDNHDSALVESYPPGRSILANRSALAAEGLDTCHARLHP